MKFYRHRKRRSLEKLDQELRSIEDPIGRALIVLLEARYIGTEIDRLAAHTGYPREFIQGISDRMNEARLWIGNFVDDTGCFDSQGRPTWQSFAHAQVALGDLLVERTDDGILLYLDYETRAVLGTSADPIRRNVRTNPTDIVRSTSKPNGTGRTRAIDCGSRRGGRMKMTKYPKCVVLRCSSGPCSKCSKYVEALHGVVLYQGGRLNCYCEGCCSECAASRAGREI